MKNYIFILLLLFIIMSGTVNLNNNLVSIDGSGNLTVTGNISEYITAGFADSTVTIAMTQNNYFHVSSPTHTLYTQDVAASSGNISWVGDSVQVATTNNYKVSWYLSISGNLLDSYHISIFVNNVEQNGKGEANQDMTNNDTHAACGTAILHLTTGDWIKLKIKNTANNNDATIHAGGFLVERK